MDDQKCIELSVGSPDIGGFLFHIFWEAASQYMLPYFIMLVPYGVMGLKDAGDMAEDKIRMHGAKDRA